MEPSMQLQTYEMMIDGTMYNDDRWIDIAKLQTMAC